MVQRNLYYYQKVLEMSSINTPTVKGNITSPTLNGTLSSASVIGTIPSSSHIVGTTDYEQLNNKTLSLDLKINEYLLVYDKKGEIIDKYKYIGNNEYTRISFNVI